MGSQAQLSEMGPHVLSISEGSEAYGVVETPPPGAAGAVAFLGAYQAGAAAPINPRLTVLEVVAYVDALKPTHVIVPAERFDEVSAALNSDVYA
jgi:acyl-CoA synthetase (AMP-forming)/AMP-acid ligase II